MPVSVSFNADRSRAAFRIAHPKGNIITSDTLDALRAGLEGLGQIPHLKLVTLEGEGADFSFGASIPEHTLEHIGRVLPTMHALVEDLLDTPAVTAAIVRGRCLGGGFELALACDLIFAAEDAMFGVPEIRLGVFAPAASVLLPARVGSARATTDLITGQQRPAQYWLNAGLVELTAPSADLAARVDDWFATHLAPKSAAALRHAAAAVRTSVRENVRVTLPVVERLYLEGVMGTHDAKEGLDAFMQKRAPRWLDR
jgi:cyclohexa-1,5-dienecarbonyl-CoA hydratase